MDSLSASVGMGYFQEVKKYNFANGLLLQKVMVLVVYFRFKYAFSSAAISFWLQEETWYAWLWTGSGKCKISLTTPDRVRWVTGLQTVLPGRLRTTGNLLITQPGLIRLESSNPP
jgi:hypothetical protein